MTGPAPANGLRYTLVGGACALTHNGVMIGGAVVGLHYLASAAISFAVVVVLGYALHTAYTFRSPASAAAFGRYALAMLANYPGAVAVLFVLCDLLHAPMAVASPTTTVVLFAWNYLASRWAITRNRAPAGNGPPT